MKEKSIIDLIHSLEQELHTGYPDRTLCRQYAWWIVEAITQKDKVTLLTQPTYCLTAEEKNKLADWQNKLIIDHMPLQYLLGSVPFCGLDIIVEPPTLIPRPETEEWVAHLIAQLKQLNNQAITILDIGSGSGCIALALAAALPQATVHAGDISNKALTLAQKNAAQNKVSNVSFVHSDLFKAFEGQQFDLIVSNPPYITPEAWQQLDPSVREWEDPQALSAPHEGLAIIEKILQKAPAFLRHNQEMIDKKIPQCAIEIGYDQGAAVAALMKKNGLSNVVIEKDLEDHDRLVTGIKADVVTP